MPQEKSEHGEVFVTSSGDRVLIDEHKIKAVPDGSRRLSWNHLPATPIPQETRPQPAPTRCGSYYEGQNECNPIDTPEYRAQFGTGITPNFIKVVETGVGNRTRVEQIIPESWLSNDPIVKLCSREYRTAVQARAAGLPYDPNVIALQTSPEWSDLSFRAAYYNSRRPKR